MVIDLVLEDPRPQTLLVDVALRLALASLHRRFAEILGSEGFSLRDVREAKLFFEFPAVYPADDCCNCHAKLVAMNGKAYTHAVDYLGTSITPWFTKDPEVHGARDA